MRRFAALMLLAGCTTTVIEQIPVIPKIESARPETIPLPTDPELLRLPDGTPPDDFVLALSVGKPSPKDGILLSEARAVRDGFFRTGYKELRMICEGDRKVMGAQRNLYEALITEGNKALSKAGRRSWWELHRGEVMFFAGILLGGGLVIGGGHALNAGN